MKNNLVWSIILLLKVLCSVQGLSQAQNLPPLPVKNLIAPNVTANVLVQQRGYSYNYGLANGINASQSIWRFMIELRDSVDSFTAPQNWNAGKYDYDTIEVVTWDSYLSTHYILPNRSLTGFGMKSAGLPKILRYWVRAFERIPSEEGQYDPASFNIFATHLCRTTIGPATPPHPFAALSFLDTISSYVAQSALLGWIKNQTTANRYLNSLNSAKSNLQQNDISGARTTLQTVLINAISDSSSNLTSEAYALIYYNTQYLLAQLPIPPSGFTVKLVSSLGTKLTGGSLQYYDGSWKDAVNNNDGTFSVNTTLKTVSLRMTYAYGAQTKSNLTVGTDTVVFQTVAAQVKLENSQGTLIDTGSVQYYAGAWRPFGTTSNGVATMELLPVNYSFRMTYAYASNDKAQDLSVNPVVEFQTVNSTVQLHNSQGVLMDTGTVQYYSGAWRTFGTTSNGTATMELLPNNYSFRMTYAYASNDKQQNLGSNATVVFSTVNATVQLKNSQGSLIDQGSVQYYSGAWRTFGVASNGISNKELLPNNYSFRMTYAYVSNDKQQDLNSNSVVAFQTVLATVNVVNTQNSPVNNAIVTYYSGAWRQFGNTVNGNITKELLPANLQFRATSGSVSQNKTQDLSTNPLVVISLNVSQ